MREIVGWNAYFMGIAYAVSIRSKDSSTQVGSLIIDDKKRIISTGYNGFPRGIEDTEERWAKDNKHQFLVHAEASAIAHGGNELAGGTLYVTLHPCLECAKLVIAAGIKEVVYDNYRPTYKLASELLAEAGIKTTQQSR